MEVDEPAVLADVMFIWSFNLTDTNKDCAVAPELIGPTIQETLFDRNLAEPQGCENPSDSRALWRT